MNCPWESRIPALKEVNRGGQCIHATASGCPTCKYYERTLAALPNNWWLEGVSKSLVVGGADDAEE